MPMLGSVYGQSSGGELSNAPGVDGASAATRARAAAYDRMLPAYDLIITSSALLGGFAINAALETIKESDFGNQVAFDSYAILLVASAVLDLYAVVALVFNRYAALRVYRLSAEEMASLEAVADGSDAASLLVARFDEQKRRLHVSFLHSSRAFRTSALYAFVLSLPCFLGALAAKQFSVQPMRAHHESSVSGVIIRSVAFEPPSAPAAPLVEPFTPIRWALATLVFVGMLSVVVAIAAQLFLLRQSLRGRGLLGAG